MDQWVDLNALTVWLIAVAGLLHLLIRAGQAIIVERVERRHRLAG